MHVQAVCQPPSKEEEEEEEEEDTLQIFHNIMRSATDYGCFIYGAAAKTYLNRIERELNKALRIFTGGTRTTPINEIQAEAGEAPTDTRRDKLMMSYWIRLQGSENPAGDLDGLQGRKIRRILVKLKDVLFSTPTLRSVIPPWLFPNLKLIST